MAASLRINNCVVVTIWLFILLWMLILGLASGALWHHRPAGSAPSLILIGGALLLWVIGIAITVAVARMPCYLLRLDSPARIRLYWVHPYKIIRRHYHSHQLMPAQVKEGQDSDGDPYFTAILNTPDGQTFHLTQSSDRERCQQACHRFNRAAFGHL